MLIQCAVGHILPHIPTSEPVAQPKIGDSWVCSRDVVCSRVGNVTVHRFGISATGATYERLAPVSSALWHRQGCSF